MQIVQAGGDFVVMLIVGLFWVIAQIAGAASKKKQAPPSPDFNQDEEDSVTEDPFADLMRKLSGVQELKTPPPPASRPIKEEPVEPSKPLWSTEELNEPPKPQPVAVTAKPTQPAEPPAKIAATNIQPSMEAFRSSMQSIKMPTMDLNFQTSDRRYPESAFGSPKEAERKKTGGKVPMFGKMIDPSDRQSVRRAMLSHIIFSKPKAMEGWNTPHAG